MLRLFPLTLAGALLLGCTQDFNQFSPLPGSGTSTLGTTSGSGGASTTTGSGGAGGAQAAGGQNTGGQAAGGQNAGGQNTGGQNTGGQNTGGQNTGGAAPDGGGVEDCTNGVDDDGDGNVDCADPKCSAGFVCAPALPLSGWTGPAWLYDGATASAPACGGAFGQPAYEGHRDLSSVPAVCGACACNPTGTCTLGSITLFTDSACQQIDQADPQPPVGQCGKVQNGDNAQSYEAPAPTFGGGSCKPTQPGMSKPAPTWGTTGIVCIGATSNGGCGGALCAPRPAAPFGASLCIWSPGDKACPAEYPTPHSFWDGATDNRDCSPCACDALVNGSCTATTTLYGSKDCKDNLGDVPNDGTCHQLASSAAMLAKVQVGGSCTPSGGQATGTVVEGPAKTTVCCAP